MYSDDKFYVPFYIYRDDIEGYVIITYFTDIIATRPRRIMMKMSYLGGIAWKKTIMAALYRNLTFCYLNIK